jgi:hypothetical protein
MMRKMNHAIAHWLLTSGRVAADDSTPPTLENLNAIRAFERRLIVPWLVTVMQASPSTHFVSFAQSHVLTGDRSPVDAEMLLSFNSINGACHNRHPIRKRLGIAIITATSKHA